MNYLIKLETEDNQEIERESLSEMLKTYLGRKLGKNKIKEVTTFRQPETEEFSVPGSYEATIKFVVHSSNQLTMDEVQALCGRKLGYDGSNKAVASIVVHRKYDNQTKSYPELLNPTAKVSVVSVEVVDKCPS